VKILVTGGAGFIGSHVVDRFIEAGHDVAVVDNLTTGDARWVNPRARLHVVDLRSARLADVFEKERPEVVSHLAAQASVGRSVTDPIFDASVNVVGGLGCSSAAAASGCAGSSTPRAAAPATATPT